MGLIRPKKTNVLEYDYSKSTLTNTVYSQLNGTNSYSATPEEKALGIYYVVYTYNTSGQVVKWKYNSGGSSLGQDIVCTVGETIVNINVVKAGILVTTSGGVNSYLYTRSGILLRIITKTQLSNTFAAPSFIDNNYIITTYAEYIKIFNQSNYTLLYDIAVKNISNGSVVLPITSTSWIIYQSNTSVLVYKIGDTFRYCTVTNSTSPTDMYANFVRKIMEGRI